MNRIGQFLKVDEEVFAAAVEKEFPLYSHGEIRQMYEKLKLPKRATRGSAGYDFYAPFSFWLEPGQTVKIPTGVRARMEEGWVLQLYPRSGLGFQYRLQMDNTVGIIDSDYFDSDNQGHIFVKLTNDTRQERTLEVAQGAGFAQGIFLPYGITVDDQAEGLRNGGFGSTDM